MIIGEKPNFGIELRTSDREGRWGAARLWINNMPIGTLDDEISLPSLVHYLERLTKQDFDHDFIFGSLNESNKTWLKKIIEHQSPQASTTIFSLPESFDDFTIRFISTAKAFVVLWKLEKEHFFNYPEQPNHEIHRASIEKQIYTRTVRNLKNSLSLS